MVNLTLIEKIVTVLLAVLRVLTDNLEKQQNSEAQADRLLAEAVRTSHVGMTDEEIIDRV